MTEYLAEAVDTRADEKLAQCCHRLGGSYSRRAEVLLSLDGSAAEAKRYYYLAALAYEVCYTLRRAGFHWYVGNAFGPYDFKRNNFNFSKDAILADAPELALSIAGEDTVEGMLAQGSDDLARRALPQAPDGLRDELELCKWAVAHRDQGNLDLGLRERIKALRRQGSRCPVTLDSWGLAIVRLARLRGLTCDLKVIELPWQLLEDAPVDTAGLALPMAEEIGAIITEKKAGGTP